MLTMRPRLDRSDNSSYFDAGFLWMSANMTISTFSLGTLGISLNGLNSTDACLTILFFSAPSALSTLNARFGC